MIKKLTLWHKEIVLELEYGEKMPYSTLIPIYSYEIEESDPIEIYTCAEPPVKIKPCEVHVNHMAFTYGRPNNRFFSHYVHYVLYGKVRYCNGN